MYFENPDWNEEDPDTTSYIRNRPSFVYTIITDNQIPSWDLAYQKYPVELSVGEDVITLTLNDDTKLSASIEFPSGSEDKYLTSAKLVGTDLILTLNDASQISASLSDFGGVQSDWNEDNPASLAYILNKPVIPSGSTDTYPTELEFSGSNLILTLNDSSQISASLDSLSLDIEYTDITDNQIASWELAYQKYPVDLSVDLDNNIVLTLNNDDKLSASLEGVNPIKGIFQVKNITIDSGSWSSGSNFWEYELFNENITETSIVDIIPRNLDISIVRQASILPEVIINNSGSVMVFAENQPTNSFNITLNIINR